MEKFTIGLVVGGMIGALCVANNYKMRQQEVQEKIDEMLDEKLRCFEEDDEQEASQKTKKSRSKKATD